MRNHKHPVTLAVIAAAGSSSRMQGQDKLFEDLCGMPVLSHTLSNYEHASLVDAIYIVTRQDALKLVESLVETYGFKKVEAIIAGGNTRQISVRNALDEVGKRREEKRFKYIAIADGARCLTTPEQIDPIIREAYATEAAAAGIPAVDTIKICDNSGYIEQTPDRNTVWLAQTPQVFRYALYMAAAYSAEKDDFSATDDNSLVERIEHPVKMVDCGNDNIKITRPLDLELAKTILTFRKESVTCGSDKDMTSTDSPKTEN